MDELLVPKAPDWIVQIGLAPAWSERVAGQLLARYAARQGIERQVEVFHGQHSVSGVAAGRAARLARRSGSRCVSVATVRDYWPLCPQSTRLFSGESGEDVECPDCHEITTFTKCVSSGESNFLRRARWLARWLVTRRAASELGRCDAVIAVSHYVRRELVRSRRVAAQKVVAIPNLVDLPSVAAALEEPWPLHNIPQVEPFVLFVGKLDANKGAHLLPQALARAGLEMLLIIAGNGPLQPQIKESAKRLGQAVYFANWLDNESAISLIHQARALLFPSAWQEPLSRVLLEGCAAGAAIVALDTGGTRDIIEHGRSGWLAANIEDFSSGIRAVTGDEHLNRKLRQGAREQAERKFAAPQVALEMTELYTMTLRKAGGS